MPRKRRRERRRRGEKNSPTHHEAEQLERKGMINWIHQTGVDGAVRGGRGGRVYVTSNKAWIHILYFQRLDIKN